MQVAITCRHGTVSEDVHDYIVRKAEKLLTYFDRITSIQVTVEVGKDRFTTELIVDAEHRQGFVARETGEEATATFDRALQKMEQQIRRYKERIQDHRRKGSASAEE